jgi:hypothetical protein
MEAEIILSFRVKAGYLIIIRQPAFFAHACPRLERQVYCPAFLLISLNASTQYPYPNN